ncbi:ABC transporter substrate-binding protein [Diaphorobacter aerolatus]|uniref:ABC transporter substrate-binding protein n=1 Tax=Diaphorobacter aerolatus TaxID=1288495 RepID=A0A7H0GHM3_9BURK|nr:ABC transporter substrate-binding protein [Diaphorobacter aerolatus]QNP47789.1 ABC transporter substrate-binding protein [Diaphorobacter aerolatus]
MLCLNSHWRVRAAVFLATLLALGGAARAERAERARPVVIDVCGKPVTYTAVPQRAVTHDSNITEMFLFLGLGPKLVGYSGIAGDKELSPAYRAALAGVPDLSRKSMNLESMLGVRADFVFAGWNYGFRAGGVTPELLARYAIDSYVLRESCIHVQKRERVSLVDGVADMRNLARIFDVEERNADRLGAIETRVHALAERMRGLEKRPRVFVFDSGQRLPVTVGRFGMPHAMIEAAGGENIFSDIESNWPTGNWEDVIARNPEWIIIVDYGQPDAQGKIDFLLGKRELSQVSAIRNRRFFVMRYAQATPGPGNVDMAEALARKLHPERFVGAQK